MLNRSWFISGVCGTIGGKLLERVLELQPRQVIGIDNNESELFFLYEKAKNNPRIKVYSCDLRDRAEVESRMDGCEFVLHAAAVKHQRFAPVAHEVSQFTDAFAQRGVGRGVWRC